MSDSRSEASVIIAGELYLQDELKYWAPHQGAGGVPGPAVGPGAVPAGDGRSDHSFLHTL